jgi:aryl-alcohol dehydrogenase-like predicted oxidoreductase
VKLSAAPVLIRCRHNGYRGSVNVAQTRSAVVRAPGKPDEDDETERRMEFRYLGNSGLKVSAVSYGNWVTHGSQIEADRATACVRAALDAGITTFDTADAYANGKAESILGDALAGERRESLEIFTKVFWPTGPGGPNDSGLSRKHILESVHASLRRLRTDYVDLYQAHRYDHETPLEETMQAFADVVRAGKALYIGVSEWSADQLRAGAALARDLKISLVSNQPQYSALYRIIEAEVIPTSRELGISQIVFSPIAQGVLTGKYQPGQPPPEGSRATDADGSRFISRLLDDEVLERVQELAPVAEAEGLTMAQLAVAWVLQNDNVASAITGGSRPEQVQANAQAAGKKLSPETMAGIDEALAEVAESDASLVGQSSPASRPGA